MNILTYQKFYRQHGLRNVGQLTRPLMAPMTALALPIESLVHHTDLDPETVSIDEKDPVLLLNHLPVAIDHVSDMTGNEHVGNPRVHSLQVLHLLQDWHHAHKKLKQLSRYPALMRNQRSLIVESYTLLGRRYTYPNNYLHDYAVWYNLYGTVLDKAQKLGSTNDRQQYILLNLPALLPSLQQLTNSANKISPQTCARFNSDSLRWIVDLWHWLGPDRGKAVGERTGYKEADLSPEQREAHDKVAHLKGIHHELLDRVDARTLSKLNIVWMHGGLWTVMNLGTLDGMRKPDRESKDLPGQPRLDPLVLQKRFLRMLMAILETSTVTIEKHETDEHDVVGSSSDADQVHRTDEEGGDIVKAVDLDVRQEPYPLAPVGQQHGLKPKAGADSLFRLVGKANLFDEAQDTADGDEDDIDIGSESDDEALARLDEINRVADAQAELSTTYREHVPTHLSLEGAVENLAISYGTKGLLSPAEVRGFSKLANKYKTLPNPFEEEGVLADMLHIPPEDIHIGDDNPLATAISGVTDPSMLNSSLKTYDERYVQKVMQRHIAKTVMSFQKDGVAVADYNIQRVDNYTDSFDIHSIKLVPVVGKSTIVKLQYPRVNNDGVFKASGVDYRMRKQKNSMPICKVAPDVVTMTSYYSKIFLRRAERATFNYAKWLGDKMVALSMEDGSRMKNVKLGDVFYADARVPRVYSIIAGRMKTFEVGKYKFCFDYLHRGAFFGKEAMQEFDSHDNSDEAVGRLMVGLSADGKSAFYMQANGQLRHEPPPPKGDFAFGIETVLELEGDRPHDMAELDVFGQTVPLGFLLGYHIGLGNLIATLKPTVRRAKKGGNYNMTRTEYAVKFKDEVLIFDTQSEHDQMCTLVFSGLNRYHRDIKNYSVYDFDRKDVYANLLEDTGIGARYLREFDLMFKLWVDHITEELLIKMKMPTDFFDLLIKAVGMLTVDAHLDETDESTLRVRGYERFSGMLYGEIVRAMRDYHSRPMNANNTVSINPEAVWMNILKDQTVMPIEESNPVHSLKETEVVTYSGAQGRTGRSMVARTRTMHPSALGKVSEATVDNADVATIVYMPPDPTFDSVLGTTTPIKSLDGNAAKLISTSFLLAPGAHMDDPKRVNFISVQNSQTTHCEAATPLPCRTGYERVLIHRTGDLFGRTAAEDGEVIGLTEDVLSVKYKSGKLANFHIGRRFGNWAGHVVPHELVPDVKMGQKFKKADPLFHNSNYFTRDKLDPSQVIYKGGVMTLVALQETTDTLEDSCAISEDLAEKLYTMTTHVRSIKVAFDQEVQDLVKTGTAILDPDTILCIIHNDSEGNSELFNKKALATLSAIASSSPRAKLKGRVEKIEVLYTGDIEDMTPSLRKLAESSDESIRRHNKRMGKRAIDGLVEIGFRVDGHPMEANTAVIRVYITYPSHMGGGDKLVFGNQMKSIVARTMYGVNTTLEGKKIGAFFSRQSIDRRIVQSADEVGTTSTLLIALGGMALKAYDTGKIK